MHHFLDNSDDEYEEVELEIEVTDSEASDCEAQCDEEVSSEKII